MAYAGSVEEVVRYLGTIVTIGPGEADSLTSAAVEKFMSDTDEQIDSILGQNYYTPLRQITRGSVTKYPDPIPKIAKILTCANIIEVFFKDVSPNQSAAVAKLQEEASLDLNRLVNSVGLGSSKLDGQTIKARNRFVSPALVPSTPPTPTVGPAGGLGAA